MRIVNDIGAKSVTDSLRHITDTYARPSVARSAGSSLRSLSETLREWTPVFTSYYLKKEQDKYNRDVAEGKALAQELQTQGYDIGSLAMEDIRTLVDKGYSSRLAKLNRFHEHGINIVQMDTAAKGLEGAADDWFKNGLWEDETKTLRHVYEISDPVEFEKQFRQFAADRWAKIAGSHYDPVLYEKQYLPALESVRKKIETQYFTYKGKIKTLESQKIMSENLDAGVVRHLNSGAYLADRDFTRKFADELARNYAYLAASDSPAAALEGIQNYLAALSYGKTPHQLRTIQSALSLVPEIWNDPGTRQKMTNIIQQQEFFDESRRSRRLREAEYARFREERRRNDQLLATLIASGIRLDYSSEGQANVVELLKRGVPVGTVIKARTQSNATVSGAARESESLAGFGARTPEVIKSDPSISSSQKVKELAAYQEHYSKYIVDIRKHPVMQPILQKLGYTARNDLTGTIFGVQDKAVDLEILNSIFRDRQMQAINKISLEKLVTNAPEALAELERARTSFVTDSTGKQIDSELLGMKFAALIDQERERRNPLHSVPSTNIANALAAQKDPVNHANTDKFIEGLTARLKELPAGVEYGDLVLSGEFATEEFLDKVACELLLNPFYVDNTAIDNPETLFNVLSAIEFESRPKQQTQE